MSNEAEQHDSAGEVTRLLGRLSGGQKEALGQLIPLVYSDLKRVAAHYLATERASHTLQPTALVHEAYFRLVEQKDRSFENRAQFFAVAAQIMRRILLDHARRRHAQKRGGSAILVDADECVAVSEDRLIDIIVLDELLTRLGAIDPAQARVVELRFFAGLSVEETAPILGVSTTTVKREWSVARAWLLKEMAKARRHDSGTVAAS